MNTKGKIECIRILFFILAFGLIAGTSCSPTPSASSASMNEVSREAALKKIHLDLTEIDKNGIIGPPDGKREIAYEFCIPLAKAKRKEVSAIDKSVKFFDDSNGIDRENAQYVCIGSGATREVLIKLASLDYVKKIKPFYGE